MSDEDGAVDPSASVPSEFPQVLGSQSVDDEDRKMVVAFIASLQVTRNVILRSVPAFKVLQLFGGVFRKRTDPEKLYALSRQCESIEEFWSHSWRSGKFWKIWLLLMLKNGLAACLLGTLVAFIATVLSFMHLLPGFYKEPLRSTGADIQYRFSPWAQVFGNLVALLTLLFWRSKTEVFLDRACIHQGDQRLKAEGVLNIGAFIAQSERLVVIWDSTYATRAWCVFELAAFLKSRQDKPCRLLIKPLILAPFTFALIIGHSGPLLCETLLPGGFFFIRILYLIPFLITFLVLHHYWRGILQGDEQLRNFHWKDTTCDCCSRNHVDEHVSIPCDKEKLSGCIRQWFGSVDNFDHLVRSEVRAAFRSQMTKIPFGYWWLVGCATSLLWYHLDLSISRGNHWAFMVAYLSSSIPWQFWIIPGLICLMFGLQRKCHPVIGYFMYQFFLCFLWSYWYMSWVLVSDEVLAAIMFVGGTLPVFAAVLRLFQSQE